ncbi:MAG: SDR family oxidoreductase [Bdellovibrionota bacterium]|nr:MAG: SDR family oxidoreductase [Bdellovibrionota bacterium]
MNKIVICGATSAIAVEVAREYASRGATLYLVARDGERLSTLASDLKARGASGVHTEVLDLALNEHHQALLARIKDILGAIDALLIAYGVLPDQQRCEEDVEATMQLLQVNTLSVISLLTLFGNEFAKQERGTIAVISSVAADRGRKSNYVYCTSKAALDVFLQGLRNRLFSNGVHVLTIKPGFVDTPMTAHLKKGLLFAEAAEVGRGIVKAIDRKKDVVYLPWFWIIIMAIVRNIPERLFKRMSI